MRYQARAPLRIDFGGGWTDVPLFADREGGAVLNAAITRYVEGYISRPNVEGILRAVRGDRSYLQYSLDLPSGAGLGASAAQTLVWLALVKTTVANVSDRTTLAEMACAIAPMLGILGGKQDEYASALGGIAYYTFGKTIERENIPLSSDDLDRFRSRLVLVYSGQRRLSGSIHEDVWTRYRSGEESVVTSLRSLKRIAQELKTSLQQRDFDAFGALLSENWSYQQALHPSVSNPTLDEIFALALRAGAIGGKVCGAGGGGCVIFVAKEGQAPHLTAAFRAKKLQTFDFEFDTYGVFVTKG